MSLQRVGGIVVSFALVSYLLLLGATWNGVLSPNFQRMTLLLLAGAGAMGWVVRWRRRWVWHRTPLDSLLPLWAGVCVLSIAANPETWRRSAEALWYFLLYVLVWYALMDAFANGAKPRMWLQAVTLTGLVQLPIIGLQVFNFYAQGGTGLPRPVGLAGNPNLLGAYYVVFLPLALMAWFEARGRLARWVVGAYVLLSALVLVATFSRGAWLGGAAAVGLIGWFVLSQHGTQSPRAVWQAWLRLSKPRRWLSGMVVGTFAVGAVLLLVTIAASFNVSGRGAELRILPWQYAWELFIRQPLTGAGLFTYGYHLGSFWSIPPEQPHSHPHNLPLLIAAELGVGGVAVSLLMAAAVGRAAQQQWQRTPPTQRWPLAASAAALVGMGVHHLLDTPMMMPSVALLVVMLAAVVSTSAQPIPMAARWRQIGHPIGIAGLGAGLLAVGFWQSGLIAQYTAILGEVVQGGSSARAAAQLEQVIAQDPFNAAYRRQHAYLLGLAAAQDEALLAPAIEAYITLNQLEPFYAADFVNHAALRWQAGEVPQAIALAERAAELAPEWTLAHEQAAFYRGEREQPPTVIESPYAPNTAYFQMLRYVIVTELLPQIERAAP
jgi:putative inorganic carbon (HCO3(-)) transporter